MSVWKKKGEQKDDCEYLSITKARQGKNSREDEGEENEFSV